jgi:hypothetical protein
MGVSCASIAEAEWYRVGISPFVSVDERALFFPTFVRHLQMRGEPRLRSVALPVTEAEWYRERGPFRLCMTRGFFAFRGRPM